MRKSNWKVKRQTGQTWHLNEVDGALRFRGWIQDSGFRV